MVNNLGVNNNLASDIAAPGGLGANSRSLRPQQDPH